MRFLLIAYEFPPSPSPQSLRWAYLSRELIRLGHEVHVVTIHLGGETPGLPEMPAELQVHRSFAGPVRGLLAALRDRRKRISDAHSSAHTMQPPALRPPRSWKQNASERVQSLAAQLMFPDVRGEWFPWGKRMVMAQLRIIRPDVVISSHEPATTLQLGLLAKRQGFNWIADLGDPVLAPYTPERWRSRARELERQVCHSADHITVTHAGAAHLLAQRHGRLENISVLTQGYLPDTSSHATILPNSFESHRLELLYTGSFYQFRRPDELIDAILSHPSARLNIASVTVPESIVQLAQQHPEQIRLLGFLPHNLALAMQRKADVLINISNDDPSQVPGKFYEYLGSGRPILHIGSEHDAISVLLQYIGRGWSSANSVDALSHWLERTVAEKASGNLGAGLALDTDTVSEYGWPSIARRFESIALTLSAAHEAD